MIRTLIATAALIATPAFAQSLKTHIPFPFQVGSKTMPSGNYEVQRLDIGTDRPYALYHESGSSSAVLRFPVTQSDRSTPQVSFTRRGSTVELTRLCVGGTCRSLPAHGKGDSVEVAAVAVGRR